MTKKVKFIRGNDRVSRLAQRPDLAEGVAQVRRDMDEADRTYAMGLAALRQAAELTQVELARRMGVTQAAVSRMEQPHDLLLSTLNGYLEAVGGRAIVIVRFADGHEAQLDLSQLTALSATAAKVRCQRRTAMGAYPRQMVAEWFLPEKYAFEAVCRRCTRRLLARAVV